MRYLSRAALFVSLTSLPTLAIAQAGNQAIDAVELIAQ